MKKRTLAFAAPVVAGACLYLGLSSTTIAQKPEEKPGPDVKIETGTKPKPSPAAAAVERMAMAHSLAKYGRQAKSPTALIAAAEILGAIPTTPLKAKPEHRRDEGSANAPAGRAEERARGQQARDNEPASLLAEAKAMADDDPHVVALADRVARALEERPRGAVGGPHREVHVVSAHSSDRFVVPFHSDELAAVALSGDGSTDLDLYVGDQNGNLIGKDDDNTDDCLVRWVPKWTGPFLIMVRNPGSEANRYVIVTN